MPMSTEVEIGSARPDAEILSIQQGFNTQLQVTFEGKDKVGGVENGEVRGRGGLSENLAFKPPSVLLTASGDTEGDTPKFSNGGAGHAAGGAGEGEERGSFRMLGTSTRSQAAVRRLVENIEGGLTACVEPEACREGLGGTYFFRDKAGKNQAIIKPTDEEPMAPNNPKGFVGREMGEPGMTKSVRVGEAAAREVAAFLLDHGRFAKVPRTALVEATHPIFHSATGDKPHGGMTKVASLQEYISHEYDASEHGTSRFPAGAVHRIGILDMRIFNTDRHSGNILVRTRDLRAEREERGGRIQRSAHKSLANLSTAAFQNKIDQSDTELIPIDHGYALPETLEAAYFEWLHWPQASLPFSEEELAYIASLDPVADAHMLERELPGMIRLSSLRIIEIATTMLQRGAAAGLCLAEIGNVMSRPIVGIDEEPSELERLCMAAQEACEEEWQEILEMQDSIRSSNKSNLSIPSPSESTRGGGGSGNGVGGGGVPSCTSPASRNSDVPDDLFQFDTEDRDSIPYTPPIGSPNSVATPGRPGVGGAGVDPYSSYDGSSYPSTPTPSVTSPIRIRRSARRRHQVSQLSYEDEEGMARTMGEGGAGAGARLMRANLGGAKGLAKAKGSSGPAMVDNSFFAEAPGAKWQLFMDVLCEQIDAALTQEWWKSRLQLVTDQGTRLQQFGTSCPNHVQYG